MALLCVLLVISLVIFVLHIKDLPTTTTCLSSTTLKQSSQLQCSNWYTRICIIQLQISDTCYNSSLYKSSIMRSVRLYIYIYVARVWNILYLHINITNIKANRIGGTCSKMANTKFSAGNFKERKKIRRPRLWEDLV